MTQTRLHVDVASASAPGAELAATDYARSLLDLGALGLSWPLLATAQRGDGHAVLVLPGLTANDTSTGIVRHYLARLGYSAQRWNLGRNIGPTAKIRDGLDQRIEDLAAESGRPVSVIGWSLGGLLARQLARRHPDRIRQVITLGSPIRMARMGQSNAAPVFHSYAAQHVERWPLPLEQGQEPLTMPTTSIYSRLDGVAAWQACLDVTSDRSENIEVFASHLGIGNHAAVLWAIADRLAQPEGAWQPFEPPTWFAWAYPTPAEPCP